MVVSRNGWHFVLLAVLLVACVAVSVASADDDLDFNPSVAAGSAPILAHFARLIRTHGPAFILLLAMALTAYVVLLPQPRHTDVPASVLPADPPSSVLDQPRL